MLQICCAWRYVQRALAQQWVSVQCSGRSSSSLPSCCFLLRTALRCVLALIECSISAAALQQECVSQSTGSPLLLSVHPVFSMHSCLRLSCCQFALQGIVGEGYNRVLDGIAQHYPDDGSFIGNPNNYILPGFFPRSGAQLTAYGGQPTHALSTGHASRRARALLAA